jgi:copper chaperone CopZ
MRFRSAIFARTSSRCAAATARASAQGRSRSSTHSGCRSSPPCSYDRTLRRRHPMIRHRAAAAMLALVLSPLAAQAADKTVVLSVTNANCELCAPIVKKSLARVTGVKAVDVKQAGRALPASGQKAASPIGVRSCARRTSWCPPCGKRSTSTSCRPGSRLLSCSRTLLHRNNGFERQRGRAPRWASWCLGSSSPGSTPRSSLAHSMASMSSSSSIPFLLHDGWNLTIEDVAHAIQEINDRYDTKLKRHRKLVNGTAAMPCTGQE